MEDNKSAENQQRKFNEKSLKNLVPYTAGQSGNPAGRKKGSRNVSTRLKELMENIKLTGITMKEFGVTADQSIPAMDLMLMQLMAQAVLLGDRKSTQLILEYVEGKPVQAIKNINEDPVEKIRIEVVRSKP